jgi:serine/threonine protein kinase
LTAYATRQNDIWALGVILVNLTCGRNPWRQASPDDDTFRAFVHDSEFLPTILPVSYDCNEILKRIFAIDPQTRITLPELRQAVRKVTRFTMTNEELRRAPEACKAAARAAWSDAQKAIRRHPVIVPAIVIEEHSPIPRNFVVTSNRDHHPIDRIQTISLSAGSEHISSSQHGYSQVASSSTIGSVAPYHASAPRSASETELHAVSVVSSRSSAAESSGPVTPEWNPNADATVGLPDVADEPLLLDATPAAVITQKAHAARPITDTVIKGGGSVKEVPINSMRGVKELWRKVRF